MKNRYTIKLMLLVLAISSTLYSNMLYSADESLIPREELFMCIDRNVYCVDEILNFRIFNTSNDDLKNHEWSRVVNVEIISPDGRSVARGKFPFNKNGALGNLYLSDNILSGNYYVRAYTKWMRNQTASDYFYERVKIINPFDTKVLTPIKIAGLINIVEEDTIISSSEKIFKIDNNHFIKNEKATITISKTFAKYNANDICVSIVKKGTLNEGTLDFKQSEKAIKEFTFIPELKGVSISGKVLNSTDSIPISYAKVWITMQGKETISKEVMCNVEGEFSIQLGENYGKSNIFLYPNIINKKLTPKIFIDNDLAYSNLILPHVPFNIKGNEYEMIEKMMISSQINRAYNPFKFDDDSINFQIDTTNFFYGKPDFKLKFDEYIELPTLADYFKEVIPKVRIKKENKQRYFQITGPYPELSIFEPLVLVDMVKIGNVEDILTISPSLFDRIEVVEMPYLRGDISYGGIIHFISKKADFAQILFPKESVIVSYNLLDSAIKQDFSNPILPHKPFIENCLYWNSSLLFESGNEVEIEFNTGSEPDVYQLKIEGVTMKGIPFVDIFDINID